MAGAARPVGRRPGPGSRDDPRPLRRPPATHVSCRGRLRRTEAGGDPVTVRRGGRPPTDGRRDHLDWLGLIEVSGPFLTLPVLTRVWPTLDAVDPATREALRFAHAEAPDDAAGWIEFVLSGLLGWGDALRRDGMAELGLAVPEH